MYCDFYQMRERPFNVTADPKFLYLNARYREALASLHYGITQRKGFVTLIGEAGTGKTTLLKKLLDDLDATTRTVFVFNTNVTFDEILEYIFGEFDLPVHNGKRLYMLQRLNTFLLEELGKGRNVALLIDEAQDLEYSVLEDLRLLSNLETAKEKILQIVLSGQPELGQKLGNPGLRQLRQRIAVSCRLLPLTREELTEYIQSRLTAAGAADPKLFTRDAEERIFEISTGIPRLVNIVCDNALVIGYALGKKRIGAEVVNEAAADLLTGDNPDPVTILGDEPPPVPTVAAPPQGRRLSQFGVVAVVVAALVIGLLFVGRNVLRARDVATVEHAMVPRPPLEVVHPGLRDEADARAARVPAADGAADVSAPPANAAAAAAPVPNGAPASEGDRPLPGAGASRGIGPDVLADAIAAAATDPRLPAPRPAAQPAVDGSGERGQAAAPVSAPSAPFAAANGAATGGANPVNVRPPDGSGSAPPNAPMVPPAPVAPAPVVAAAPAAPVVVASAPAAPVVAPAPAVVAVPAAPKVPEAAPDTADDLRLVLPNYKRVQVRPGDSISQIATSTYGQASATMLDLMKMANPSIRDLDVISVGQEIRLPQLDEGLAVLQQPNGQYALLVLSTPAEARAREIGRALRKHGFEARVGKANFGAGRSVYRVVIGDLSDRSAAQAVGKQLQRVVRDDSRIAALAERLESSER
jgi:general secretion pathway protein A